MTLLSEMRQFASVLAPYASLRINDASASRLEGLFGSFDSVQLQELRNEANSLWEDLETLLAELYRRGARA